MNNEQLVALSEALAIEVKQQVPYIWDSLEEAGVPLFFLSSGLVPLPPQVNAKLNSCAIPDSWVVAAAQYPDASTANLRALLAKHKDLGMTSLAAASEFCAKEYARHQKAQAMEATKGALVTKTSAGVTALEQRLANADYEPELRDVLAQLRMHMSSGVSALSELAKQHFEPAEWLAKGRDTFARGVTSVSKAFDAMRAPKSNSSKESSVDKTGAATDDLSK